MTAENAGTRRSGSRWEPTIDRLHVSSALMAWAVWRIGGVGLAIQWYLISSWWAWDQGKSFGGRMFITCTPLFVLGAAALFQHARERGRERVAIGVGAMLLAANLVFIPLYVATW